MRRVVAALAGALFLGAVAVGSAPAASAADPIVVTCTGPVSFSGPIGQAYDFVFGPDCDTGGSTDDGVANSRAQDLSLDAAGFLSAPPSPDGSGDAWYVYAYYGPFTSTLLGTSLDGEATVSPGDPVAWTMGPGYPAATYPIVWTGPGGGDGATVDRTSNLVLDAAGGSCPTSAIAGVDGTWAATPADCTKAGSALLGWATSAAFPVDRARSQVERGWGVIDETVDGTRMIFIPAGLPTLLSGDNTLHAIWGPAAR